MARHVLLVKSHVSAFTRKDGTFVAAHDDKRTAASAPISAHHKEMAAHAETESGDDKYHFKQAADHMKNGDHKALSSLVKHSDTYQREKILEHVHPDHWESLGAKPISKDRAMSDYNKKFNPQPRTARLKNPVARSYSGSGAGNVGDSERAQYGDHFKEGDKVKDNYGKHHEVLSHVGAEVKTKGGESFHPTKVHRVK
jgi:hypothetical protein